MFFDLIEWLAKQPAPVATFLGTLAGSSLGLIALLLGALFNAHLNRRRDDRLRAEEARSIRGALAGELTGIRDALNNMAERLEKDAHDISAKGDSFLVPDITSGIRVMPPLLPKFGLLPSGTVRQVIDVYVIIEQFPRTLSLLDGTLHSDNQPYRGHIQMPGGRASVVAEIGRNTANKIDAVIAMLNV